MNSFDTADGIPQDALEALDRRARERARANGRDNDDNDEAAVGQTLAVAIGAAFSGDYAIKHFCQCGEVCVLFGESGALKSFLTVDAGLTVATQRDDGPRWLGRRVRGGGVLFIVGEGASGMPRRLRAWVQHDIRKRDSGAVPTEGRILAEAAAMPVYVYPRPIDLHFGPGDLATVISDAERALGHSVRLVVIDPLGLMLGKGSEQLNADVAQAFNNLRLAMGPNRAALLVHHSGHGDKDRERGAITIRTNADARFRVDLDEFSRVMTLGHLKEKDGPLGDDTFLTFESVLLGHDDDGDEVTSLILAATTERPEKTEYRKGGLQPTTIAALRTLGTLWTGEPIAPADWRKAMHVAGYLNADEPEDSDANRRACQRHAKALMVTELVEKIGNGSRYITYRLPRQGAQVIDFPAP